MPGRGRSRNEPGSPSDVERHDLMVKAATLRAAGATYREIGQALDIDHTWARTLVLRSLDKAAYEAADVMRVEEGERLDRLQRAVWQQALGGDVRAVAAVLRIMERRARLFGLDAPTKVEVTSDADEQIAALADALLAERAPSVRVVRGEVVDRDGGAA